MKLILDSLSKVHFVGIGGSGLSSLASVMLQKGVEVTGSDLISSVVTNELEKQGAKIYLGQHRADHLAVDVDLVIQTVAATVDNEELLQAKKIGIKVLTYPQFLGEISQQMDTIAVAGTHGKTTTTAMIGVMLTQAGFDPTIIVGSWIKDLAGGGRLGKSCYLVIEADEYRRAFLHYFPKIAVVLNVEFDHPDCYENLAAVKQAFTDFSAQAKIVVKDINQLKNDLNLQLR